MIVIAYESIFFPEHNPMNNLMTKLFRAQAKRVGVSDPKCRRYQSKACRNISLSSLDLLHCEMCPNLCKSFVLWLHLCSLGAAVAESSKAYCSLSHLAKIEWILATKPAWVAQDLIVMNVKPVSLVFSLIWIVHCAKTIKNVSRSELTLVSSLFLVKNS